MYITTNEAIALTITKIPTVFTGIGYLVRATPNNSESHPFKRLSGSVLLRHIDESAVIPKASGNILTPDPYKAGPRSSTTYRLSVRMVEVG